MAVDPVCDMQVDEQAAQRDDLSITWHGRTYVFCSHHCKERFERDPGAFAISFDEQQAPDGKTDEDYAG